MSRYRLKRGGTELGIFSEDQIRKRLRQGECFPSDLVCEEGQVDWLTLEDAFAQLDPVISTILDVPVNEETIARNEPEPAKERPLTIGCATIVGIIAIIVLMVSLATPFFPYWFSLSAGLGAGLSIFLGHLALTKIKKSEGKIGGKAEAIVGLAVGYAALLLFGLFFLATSQAFDAPQGRGELTKSLDRCRQLIFLCRIYATDHEGRLPDRLEQLIEADLVEKEELYRLLHNKHGKLDFEYLGAGMLDTDGDSKVVFKGLEVFSVKYVVGQLNTSVRAESIQPLQTPLSEGRGHK